MQQKVLVIDDSPAIQALIRARLKDEPVELYSADNAEQGLAMAATLLPDLILLDVQMPDASGFDVCRRLKADPALVAIPVIFLTGVASADDKLRGLELGAVDYVTKPFDPAELRARIRMALRMKFMVELLAQKAQVDALTGLWNRRYFEERLAAETALQRRSGRPIAVLIVGIDQIRHINERFGHPAGDEVIRRVGLYLAESVRTEDIVCRWDGKAFAIIAPNISAGAADMANRLRGGIEHLSIVVGGAPISATVSIGAAWSNGAGDPVERSALEAMRRAKQLGRNRVEFIDAAPLRKAV